MFLDIFGAFDDPFSSYDRNPPCHLIFRNRTNDFNCIFRRSKKLAPVLVAIRHTCPRVHTKKITKGHRQQQKKSRKVVDFQNFAIQNIFYYYYFLNCFDYINICIIVYRLLLKRNDTGNVLNHAGQKDEKKKMHNLIKTRINILCVRRIPRVSVYVHFINNINIIYASMYALYLTSFEYDQIYETRYTFLFALHRCVL